MEDGRGQKQRLALFLLAGFIKSPQAKLLWFHGQNIVLQNKDGVNLRLLKAVCTENIAIAS
jgi:hypothetical protein